MARDLSPKCKLCRRAKEKLFLKGERCHSVKCAMVRKAYAPGMHGQKMVRGQSEYGRQLAMKQRIKRIYGVLEKQFRKHFAEVSRKQGVTGDMLIERLETRLDNVVYRSGLAVSRQQARQIVGHGLIALNGKKATIPSMKVSAGDVVSVRENKAEKKIFADLEKRLKNNKNVPAWIAVDGKKKEAKILAEPKFSELGLNADPQLVVEFYSR